MNRTGSRNIISPDKKRCPVNLSKNGPSLHEGIIKQENAQLNHEKLFFIK